jgi:ATP synthase protein I
MSDSAKPDTPIDEPSPGAGLHAISYFLAGIGLYGGLGWVADKLFGTVWFLPVGLLFGTAAAVYLIIKRFGGRHEQ